MPEAMIHVEDLTRSFGSVHAVRGVTFDVREGEYFGLLGPNGAGKSTTLRILTTLTPPTSGVARVGGVDVTEAPDRVRAQVGLVSDKMIMYPTLTARENLRFFGRLYRVPAARLDARIDEMLALTHMEKWADAKLATFSTGMKQRLNIARALLPDPRILFLDEPTLGLDPQSTREIRDFTRELNKEHGTTIILTTHQMSEAELLCDRLAIIDQGRVIACDTPRRLKDRVAGGARRAVEVTVREGAETIVAVAKAKNVAASAEVADHHVRLLTDAPLEDVLDVVRAHGRGIVNVRTSEPTLEDVFLHLTGHEMRDSEAKKPKRVPLLVRGFVKWKTWQATRKARRASVQVPVAAAKKGGGKE